MTQALYSVCIVYYAQAETSSMTMWTDAVLASGDDEALMLSKRNMKTRKIKVHRIAGELARRITELVASTAPATSAASQGTLPFVTPESVSLLRRLEQPFVDAAATVQKDSRAAREYLEGLCREAASVLRQAGIS